MTVKQFFKSKAFKCIAVLLITLLISGALLTIAYGFLEVSAGEKLQRAISKIYGGESVKIYGKGDELIEASNSNPVSLVESTVACGDAEILSAYKITFETSADIHYLVQSKGEGGYSNGTVTCWVAVNADVEKKAVKNVAKVQVSESSGQTFMDKITDDMLTSFTTDLPSGGFSTDDGYVSAGASFSSNAICNAVNGAVSYVKEYVFGQTETSIYSSLSYTKYINVTANKTAARVDGDKLCYTVTTKPYGMASAFTLEIGVDANKKITDYKIALNGSTEGYDEKMPEEVLDGTLFLGKGVEYFTSIYGEDMTYKGIAEISGENVSAGASSSDIASNSVYLCMYAGAFATENYDSLYAALQGGESNE